MTWKADLIAGFPWDGADPDDALERCHTCAGAGLLVLEPTEPGSFDREEYGESVFRLTEAGRRALDGEKS